MAEAVAHKISGISAVFLSFHIKTLALLPSYSLTTVLGSKSVRERFTHLSISNLLCLSRKLWSIQAVVI